MKYLIVLVLVSTLLFLQTVSALSALKYFFQSPNSNKYQNRDYISRNARKVATNDDVETIPEQQIDRNTKLSSDNEIVPQREMSPVVTYPSVDSNQALQDQPITGINKMKQYIGLASVLASVNRISQNAAPQIDSVISSMEPNYPADSSTGNFISDMHFLVNNREALKIWSLLEPGLKPFEEIASSYPSIFNPIFTIGDWLILEFAEKMVPVLRRTAEFAQSTRGDAADKDAVSKKFKQYVQLVSVGANITRLSQSDAQQIDSVLADAENKYSGDSEVGNFLEGMRFVVKNRSGLKLWDFGEHHLKTWEELASYEPNLFNPVFYAADAIAHELARRFSAAVQHFGEAARAGRLQLPSSQA